MAEAIATEGGDVDAEETDEADLVALEHKGSIKTDEVKANHFSYHGRVDATWSYRMDERDF